MSEIKLLPCPFCGGEAIINTIEPHKHQTPFGGLMPDYEGETFIECVYCSCGISAETEAEAIKKWNTRKPMERIIEQLEAEKKKNENDYASGKGTVRPFYSARGIGEAIEIVKKGGIE